MTIQEAVERILRSRVVKDQAKELEELRQPLLRLRVDKQNELWKLREKYRHPKDKDYTDFDRKTMLESYTADIEAEYQYIKGLEDLVKERIELIRWL